MRRTGPSPVVRGVVMVRDAGRCQRCGAIGHQIQHRLARGNGGTSKPNINNLSNLVLLCAWCHDWVERRERKQAEDDGWWVRHGLELPSEVPMRRVDGSRFFLSDEGTVIEL